MSRLKSYALFAAQLITVFHCVDAYGQYLYKNEKLVNGDSIRYFPYGYVRYDMTMQSNCDFVYNTPSGDSRWNSGTSGKGVARECYVIMQEDCNLVAYPDSQSGPGYGSPAIWASGTDNKGQGDCYLWIGPWDNLIMGAVFDAMTNVL